MATGDFTVTYDGTSVTFNQFSGDDLPRAYLGQATLEFSALGAGYSNGPSKRQRKIWSISAYASRQKCLDLFTLFNSWDVDRANSSNTAEVDVQDELFGTTILTKGFFTSPPAISSVGNDSVYLVTFVLTEP